jgi:subtilase family serine protease
MDAGDADARAFVSQPDRMTRSAPGPPGRPPAGRMFVASCLLVGVLAGSPALARMLVGAPATGAARAASPAAVAFGLPPRAGLRRIGVAPARARVTLQLGLVADQAGIARDARAGSDPSSPGYGRYPTLSELVRSRGAPAARQRPVLAALRAVGVRAAVDAIALRVIAPMTIGQMERLFGTRWSLFAAGPGNVLVALPDGRVRIPDGFRGNVDVVAGASPFLVVGRPRPMQRGRVQVNSARPASRARSDAGGTPTRTGAVGPNCLTRLDPAALARPVGLYPNQLLTAYGIAPLHQQGLRGQGVKLAIVGEAPTSLADVARFRECFGFAGTPLHIHGGAGVPPILESSLDAMVVSAVAPQLEAFDLWVRPLADGTDDGDVGGFLQLLGAPLEAAGSDASLPDVVSVSYGICERQVAPYAAARKLVERELAAYAALGITVVVAAGDSGSSTCARGVPAAQQTAAVKRPYVSWPASSPWVLSVGGTNLTLNPNNSIASTGVWNDTSFPAPYAAVAAGGGGQSLLASRPWWQPAASFARAGARLVPDLSAFADARPGYAIICSAGVVGCVPSPGQTMAFVGGTSAATPLVAGMIALWIQKARAQGLPRVGFAPPLLYALAAKSPAAFMDVTIGSNAIYDVACCRARGGYDLATGLGSPRADSIAASLPAG